MTANAIGNNKKVSLYLKRKMARIAGHLSLSGAQDGRTFITQLVTANLFCRASVSLLKFNIVVKRFLGFGTTGAV